MRILRETIRRLILKETICANATAKIQQGLDEIERMDLKVIVEFQGPEGYDVLIKEPSGSTVGMFEVSSHSQCPAYVTMWTEVNKIYRNTGLGVVLYDVAIETATKLGNYLTCDRGTVTADAKSMWAYYNESNDYEALQMDTQEGHFTDETWDDTKQMTFFRDSKTSRDSKDFEQKFMASPFTKAYKKKTITTIPCLGDRYIEMQL